MLIKDQIDLQFETLGSLSSLNERNESNKSNEPNELYNTNMINLAEKVSKKLHIRLRQGIYLGVTGPNYETPGGIRFFKKIGADAVGMSTVLETIAAVKRE